MVRLKKTWLAPLAMGACRFFNILLGSLDCQWREFRRAMFGWAFRRSWWLWAAAVGLLIAGVTLLAKGEASTGHAQPTGT